MSKQSSAVRPFCRPAQQLGPIPLLLPSLWRFCVCTDHAAGGLQVAASRRTAGVGRGAASVARSAKSVQRRGGARLPLAAGDEVADLLDAGGRPFLSLTCS